MSVQRIFFSLITALFLLGISQTGFSQAQLPPVCNIGNDCQSDADCQDFANATIPPGGCPACIGCDPATNTCQPLDSLCDDGNECTLDECFFPLPQVNGAAPNGAAIFGCQYTTLAIDFPPPDDLPIECYICEPTANGVTVDNGICEPAAGENCSNSADCQVEGEVCGPPPPDPNCELSQQNPVNPCLDGDRCTEDLCVPLQPPAVAGTPGVCENPPKGCEPISDGCCPAGCDGPDPATADPNAEICFTAGGTTVPVPIPNCDADCWFPQVCGDGLVQPPETCDDAADAGDAGISPTGSAVSNEQCRDAGAPAECTYCGDGIIQAAAGEECEVGLIGSCGSTGTGGTCDLTTCQCMENVCVTGSGNPFDEIRPGCANCSLNKGAVSQGLLQDYRAFLLMAMILGLGLMVRRRSY